LGTVRAALSEAAYAVRAARAEGRLAGLAACGRLAALARLGDGFMRLILASAVSRWEVRAKTPPPRAGRVHGRKLGR
jgi:hypothetical protein